MREFYKKSLVEDGLAFTRWYLEKHPSEEQSDDNDEKKKHGDKEAHDDKMARKMSSFAP